MVIVIIMSYYYDIMSYDAYLYMQHAVQYRDLVLYNNIVYCMTGFTADVVV